jgi:hypothetical protein
MFRVKTDSTSILCSYFVFVFCVHILCSYFVLVFCVHILCSYFVFIFCVRTLCSYFVFVYCVHISVHHKSTYLEGQQDAVLSSLY